MTLHEQPNRDRTSDVEAILIILAAVWLLHHHSHYRRHRRAGFGVWYSLRGPWGSRVSISKRF